MSKPQDFVTDNNPTAIFHLDRTIGTPDYVKSAAIISSDDVAPLPDMAFADTVNRLWPVFSKVSTWCSAADFFGKGNIENEKVAAKIRKAAEIFGIQEDVAKVEAEFQNLEKKASRDERKYALVVDFGGAFGNEQPTGYYPINECGEVLTSAENLMKDASSGGLPTEYFRSASKEILKAASEFGIEEDELHNRIVRYGTPRLPDFDKAAYSLEERKRDGMTDEHLNEYQTILESAREEFDKSASNDLEKAIEENDKWVDLWCSLDREHGVKYANVTNPFDAFYTGQPVSELEKMAKTNVVINDVMVPRVELACLTNEELERSFRDSDAAIIKSARDHCLTYKDEVGTGHASTILEKLDADVSKDLLVMMASKN